MTQKEHVKALSLEAHRLTVRAYIESGWREVSETTFGKTYRSTVLGRGPEHVRISFDPEHLLEQKPELQGLMEQADALDGDRSSQATGGKP